MTLSQLRYAITVADSRSMNQAAQKLFISQPSLSAAIRELEDEVGIEIFRRTNRGIQVTPDGEEFVGYARQVVEQYALNWISLWNQIRTQIGRGSFFKFSISMVL